MEKRRGTLVEGFNLFNELLCVPPHTSVYLLVFSTASPYAQEEETLDAYGNIIKIKAMKVKMTNKEKKAAEKLRKARKERGEVVTDSEEEV